MKFKSELEFGIDVGILVQDDIKLVVVKEGEERISLRTLYSFLKSEWYRGDILIKNSFPMEYIGISMSNGESIWEMINGWKLIDKSNRIYIPKFIEVNGVYL